MHPVMPAPVDPEEAIPPAHLIDALRAAGASQAKLAKSLNMTGESVNRWCRGKTPITRSRWLAILSALGLPADWEPGSPPF